MSNEKLQGYWGGDALIEALIDPASYVHTVAGPVVMRETHISWVLLAGKFAYKIKKPITTDFLDYGSLENRHHACCEEYRLGSRYAIGLYLDVVPITFEDGKIRMDGDAQPIEYAVRMRRFDDDALLSHRLAKDLVSSENMIQLGAAIGGFHRSAFHLRTPPMDILSRIERQALQNFDLLLCEPLLSLDSSVHRLKSWTETTFEIHRTEFMARVVGGFIRECHGDLHCENIAFWQGHFVPFDGIEFNQEYSWIDVASDIAFLVMDLQKRGHPSLSALFLNSYLEQTGDYQALFVLRWYMVYRALVRAKVAVMQARQQNQVERLNMEQLVAAKEYICLAEHLTEIGRRRLWITHGVSGSGKTSGSQPMVEREGAVRIRSDVERKRLFKTSKKNEADNRFGEGMYSPTASEATYQRLFDLAWTILRSDFPALVDATFLRRADRQRFQSLAKGEGADFRILNFEADEATLKERIAHRRLTSNDASDATLEILANQILNQERLTSDELEWTETATERGVEAP